MTGFDIIVLAVVGVAAIGGFARGFIQEVLSLLAWVLAVFAIRYLHTDLTEFLFGYLGSPNSAAILAFALLLLIPYAAMKVIAGNIGKASRKSVIGPIDRVLGFGFGAIKGLIVTVIGFSLVVLGYDSIWGPQGRPVWIIEARSYPFINAGSEAMVQLIHERRERLHTEEIEIDGDA
jgi:membrane protein required for colicin V production